MRVVREPEAVDSTTSATQQTMSTTLDLMGRAYARCQALYGQRMTERIGVSGVVAALSVSSDLTRGHPPGEAMRACLLATALAREAGRDETDCRNVYWTALMRFAGCPATSHEIAARYGGDDIVVRSRGDLIDSSRPGEALRFSRIHLIVRD